MSLKCVQALTRAAVDDECPEAALAVARLAKVSPALGQFMLEDRSSGLSRPRGSQRQLQNGENDGGKRSRAGGSGGGGMPRTKAELRSRVADIVEEGRKYEEGAGRIHAVPRRPATGMSGRVAARMKGRRGRGRRVFVADSSVAAAVGKEAETAGGAGGTSATRPREE